jgi:small-conductance mechanosensitive channel
MIEFTSGLGPIGLTLLQQATAGAEGAFWERLIRGEDPGAFLRALLLVFLGIPLLLAAARWLRRWVGEKYTLQQGMIAGKLLLYPGLLLILISVLHQLQFSLTPLLGAAGILGIALGFASQTSVSNVISGFFLIAEGPFEVDDFVQIGDTTGRVLSIDTLSVKLRTFDNRFVRIPNEAIIKSQVTNITRFPIRRLDLNIGVAYKENVERVREVLLEVAYQEPPGPHGAGPHGVLRRVRRLGPSPATPGLGHRENFIALRNSLLEEVKARFDQEGIEIPFPHRTLYSGAGATDPFPVRVVTEPGPEAASEGSFPRDRRSPPPQPELPLS